MRAGGKIQHIPALNNINLYILEYLLDISIDMF